MMKSVVDTTTLKPGQHLFVAYSSFARVRYQAGTVRDITRGGMVTLNNGDRYRRDGRPALPAEAQGGVLRWLCVDVPAEGPAPVPDEFAQAVDAGKGAKTFGEFLLTTKLAAGSPEAWWAEVAWTIASRLER